MLITMTPAALDAVWTSLHADQRAVASPRTAECRRQMAAILKGAARDGWVGMIEAETVLMASGLGIPTGDLRETLKLFGTTPQSVFRRPGARVKGLYGRDQVAAVDIARVLQQAEDLGFAADPTPLCKALRPSLRAKAFLTSAELAVYWHDREQHRREPFRIGTGPHLACGREVTTLRTATGYRTDLYRGPDGRPTDMVVTAPHWRPRRSRLSLAA